jgi:DNA-binding protein Alba
MSYLSRDEIENIHLKARGKSISNAVNVAEQFKNRFGKEIKSRIDNVEIGTEEVPRKDKKGKIKMSFIDITMSRTEVED